MKLSEAMKQGATMHPQGAGAYAGRQGNKWYTCALGAAYEGITGNLPRMARLSRRPFNSVPELAKVYDIREAHPISGGRGDLWWLISDLNDNHHWSREQIADWLREKGY